MSTLFPIAKHPDGFSYYPEFLSPEEETVLLESIRQIEFQPMVFLGFEAKRKVASFGHDYSFEKRALSKGKPIPDSFVPLIQKVCHQVSVETSDIAQLLIIEYPEKAVMNWHRDAPPYDIIIGISLMEDCIFKFRPHEKKKQSRSSTISIPVKRRSLYVMQGAARSDWQHSGAPVIHTRYSITLRTLR